jgi:hypothetical protein
MSIKTNKIKVNVDFSHSSKTVVYWTEVYLRKYKTSKVNSPPVEFGPWRDFEEPINWS